MMNSKYWRLTISMLILIFVFVTGLTAKMAFADTTILIAKDQEAVGFDPHKVPAASSIQIYQHIYNSLVEMNSEGEIVPELATSWTIKDDVVYMFKIRKGVKFHNGREMTSDDVKYSFERILNPETASIAYSYFNKIKEIKAPDPYTIIFVLSEPYADFITNLAHVWASIVPKEVIEKNGNLMQVAIGTGPYKLAKWVPDNYTLLVKSPDYFEQGLPKADELKFLIMKDESARLAALRSGRVHISSITFNAAQQILKKEENNLKIIEYPTLSYTYLGFNTTKSPFDNPKVRLALSYVIDRDLLADIVFGGKAVVTGSVSPAQKKWAVSIDNYPSYKVDLKKAKALLKEAGYKDDLSFKIKTASSYPYMIDTAIAIQEQLKRIGVKTEVELVEWGAYVQAWKKIDHDCLVGLNGSGITPDRSLHFFFHSEGTANVWGFSDKRFDDLVTAARITVDEDNRYKLYAEAQKIIVNKLAPNLFLNSPYQFYAVNKSIVGFNPNAITGESVLKFVDLSK